MALTPSTMLPLGTQAPAFKLPNVDGCEVSLEDFKPAPALLVAFICTGIRPVEVREIFRSGARRCP